jgi:hypothetical protein
VAIFRPVSPAGTFDADGFGRLPVSLNGRVQPIDSAARRALLQIRGTVTVPQDDSRSWQFWKRPAGLGPTEWLLEALVKPDAADTRRIFRIDDAAVRTVAVQAPPTGPAPSHYSFKDLQPRVKEIGEQVARAWKVKPAERTSSDRAWLKLRDDLVLYERLKNTLQPNSFLQGQAAGRQIAYDFGAELATYEADLRTAIAARRDGKMTPQGFARLPQQAAREDENAKSTEERVVAFVRPYVGVSRAALLSIVPASGAERGGDRWLNTGAALVGSSRTGTFPASLSFFARMGGAYANGKADEFNRELASYRKWLAARKLTAEVRRARTEFFYNAFQPLLRALALYLIVLLLGVPAMIGRSTTLYRCSAMLLVLGAAVHVTGILFDMMLQGTLPVTNVYSAVICGGGIGVLLSAALERKYRNGVGLIAGAIVGLGTVGGAHGMTPGGAGRLATEVLNAEFRVAAAATVIAIVVEGLSRSSGYRASTSEAVRIEAWHEAAQG